MNHYFSLLGLLIFLSITMGAQQCVMLSVRMTFRRVSMMVMSSWKMHTPQQCQVLIGQGIFIGSRLSIWLSTLSCALKIMRNDHPDYQQDKKNLIFSHFLLHCLCVYKMTLDLC